MSNISGYKGPIPDQTPSGSDFDESQSQAILDDLRKQYDVLRAEVATAASQRARQAHQLAAEGADGLRTQIRSAPVVSLAVAAAAGGIVALALTHRTREPSWQEKASAYGSALREIDLNALAEKLRRPADAAYATARDQASGILPGVERLAQTLSSMDSSAFAPAVEKGSALFKSLWNSVAPSSKL